MGLLGKCVKYNQFFYLYPLFGNSPTGGQTGLQICMLDGSNDADLRKHEPFGGSIDIALHF